MGAFEIVGTSRYRYSTTFISSSDKCGQAGRRGWCIIDRCTFCVHSRPLGRRIIVWEAPVTKGVVYRVHWILDIGIVKVIYLVSQKFIKLYLNLWTIALTCKKSILTVPATSWHAVRAVPKCKPPPWRRNSTLCLGLSLYPGWRKVIWLCLIRRFKGASQCRWIE